MDTVLVVEGGGGEGEEGLGRLSSHISRVASEFSQRSGVFQ